MVAITVVLLFTRGIPLLCVVILVFLLGVCSIKNELCLPKNHFIHNTNITFSKHVTLLGTIISEPEQNLGNYCFVVQVKHIIAGNVLYRCCGKILVVTKQAHRRQFAEEVNLTGTLRHIRKEYPTPYSHFASYLNNQRIYAMLYPVAHKNSSATLFTGKKHNLIAYAFQLKKHLIAVFSKYLSPVTSSLLEAMLFGVKNHIPVLVRDSMVKTGTVHILVISGLNVGLVIAITLLIFKILCIPKIIRFSIAVPLIIFYCLMTQSNTPVVRATAMAIIMILAHIAKRESNLINSTSTAALIILFAHPNQLFDTGFQLSFASVFSLIYLPGRIKRIFKITALKNTSVDFLLNSILTSFAAWIGTAGIIALVFGVISPIAIVANLFIVPLALLLTLNGISLIFAGLLIPFVAPLFALSCETTAVLLLYLNSWFIGIPGAYFTLRR